MTHDNIITVSMWSCDGSLEKHNMRRVLFAEGDSATLRIRPPQPANARQNKSVTLVALVFWAGEDENPRWEKRGGCTAQRSVILPLTTEKCDSVPYAELTKRTFATSPDPVVLQYFVF